jgi:hypothetical protein
VRDPESETPAAPTLQSHHGFRGSAVSKTDPPTPPVRIAEGLDERTQGGVAVAEADDKARDSGNDALPDAVADTVDDMDADMVAETVADPKGETEGLTESDGESEAVAERDTDGVGDRVGVCDATTGYR